MLSSYQTSPRRGHLEQLIHIFAYLKKKSKLTLYIGPEEKPVIDNCAFQGSTPEEFRDLNRRMKEQREDFHFRDDFKEEVDSRHSRFDSKPLPKRGGGFLPPLYAGSTVPVSDTRARNVTRGPAVKWSEESKGISPKSTSRPVTKPLGREAFGLKNGRKVHWSE